MVKVTLFIAFLLCFPRAQAEDLNAVLKRLSQDPQWLALGHYQKASWSSYKSELVGSDFFLSPEGATNPKAEIAATAQAFLSEKNDTPAAAQCRFLARRRFLEKTLSSLGFTKFKCEEKQNWKRRLDVRKVSLIFASAYFGNAASLFGHTFLKLQTGEPRAERDLLGYGVNFGALTGADAGLSFALLGLIGGYNGAFALEPYHQMLKGYSNLEGRDVYEYDLRFTTDEIDLLIDHLLEVEHAQSPYYFFDKNCSYQIMSLLNVVRPELHLDEALSYFVIPADTIRYLYHHTELLGELKFRPAPAHGLSEKITALKRTERAIFDEIVRRKKPLAEIIEPLSPQEKIEILELASLQTDLKLGNAKPSERAQLSRLSFELKTLRAQTPLVTSAPLTSEEIPSGPDLGHDSSEWTVGLGQLAGSNFANLSFTPALHNLMNSSQGYLDNMNLELLKLDLRFYNLNKAQGAGFGLETFTLADVLTASPVTAVETPLSWQFVARDSRLLDRENFSSPTPMVNGGAGYTLRPFTHHKLDLIGLAMLDSEINSEFVSGYRLGAGTNLALHWQVLAELQVLAQYDYRRFLLGEIADLNHFKAAASWTFARNYDTRIEWREARDTSEYLLSFRGHFLL